MGMTLTLYLRKNEFEQFAESNGPWPTRCCFSYTTNIMRILALTQASGMLLKEISKLKNST